MVLQNYVELQEGVPARLHFRDHMIIAKTITDPITGGPGVRNALVFDVDRLNGVEIMSKFSTMAEKLANQFEPFLKDKSYTKYDFIITYQGSGFRRSFTVQPIPLRP